ncbi:hypothetical protein, partial [Xenorhabdus cabanillasii]|uniref:hypothetical protein n=1 Tax=Xenorhabdus cabanillasii TaxID=351673 RepID=UPI001C3F268F
TILSALNLISEYIENHQCIVKYLLFNNLEQAEKFETINRVLDDIDASLNILQFEDTFGL